MRVTGRARRLVCATRRAALGDLGSLERSDIFFFFVFFLEAFWGVGALGLIVHIHDLGGYEECVEIGLHTRAEMLDGLGVVSDGNMTSVE